MKFLFRAVFQLPLIILANEGATTIFSNLSGVSRFFIVVFFLVVYNLAQDFLK